MLKKGPIVNDYSDCCLHKKTLGKTCEKGIINGKVQETRPEKRGKRKRYNSIFHSVIFTFLNITNK